MDRDLRLRGLSSDHHHAIVLVRTIRRQLASAPAGPELRILLRREFDLELAPHFAIEEEILLPALAKAGESELAERTRAEHATLREHVRAAEGGDSVHLLRFADALETHVRFEERTMFPACEAKLDAATLEAVMSRRPPPSRSGNSADQ